MRSKSQELVLIGSLTAAVYLIVCLFYLKGAHVHSRTSRELIAWFCVLSLLPLFWRGFRLINNSFEPTVRVIVVFAGIFCLLTFLTVPFHSTDVFGYINRGWQQVHYQQNPYVYRVADVPNWQQDPMIWNHWIYNPSPYGFLFSLIARLLVWAGRGN